MPNLSFDTHKGLGINNKFFLSFYSIAVINLISLIFNLCRTNFSLCFHTKTSQIHLEFTDINSTHVPKQEKGSLNNNKKLIDISNPNVSHIKSSFNAENIDIVSHDKSRVKNTNKVKNYLTLSSSIDKTNTNLKDYTVNQSQNTVIKKFNSGILSIMEKKENVEIKIKQDDALFKDLVKKPSLNENQDEPLESQVNEEKGSVPNINYKMMLNPLQNQNQNENRSELNDKMKSDIKNISNVFYNNIKIYPIHEIKGNSYTQEIKDLKHFNISKDNIKSGLKILNQTKLSSSTKLGQSHGQHVKNIPIRTFSTIISLIQVSESIIYQYFFLILFCEKSKGGFNYSKTTISLIFSTIIFLNLIITYPVTIKLFMISINNKQLISSLFRIFILISFIVSFLIPIIVFLRNNSQIQLDSSEIMSTISSLFLGILFLSRNIFISVSQVCFNLTVNRIENIQLREKINYHCLFSSSIAKAISGILSCFLFSFILEEFDNGNFLTSLFFSITSSASLLGSLYFEKNRRIDI